jgi:2-keto-4-pentenoate hydratase/2-oxohepta-3-ene-1,7-dioic acid hydratase in catechol pathway
MTLNPGDLILTGGVPIQPTPLKARDIITIEIQDIGKLQVELSESAH